MFHISPFLNEMCLQYLDHFSASIILFFRSKSSDDFADKKRQKQKSKVESVCNNFFSISEFSYKLIRLLLNSSVVKSDNEMSKFSLNVPGGLGQCLLRGRKIIHHVGLFLSYNLFIIFRLYVKLPVIWLHIKSLY